MIGDELRLRYVEEQKGHYLDELYNITQVFIQSSWNDTSILSAQAMLLGLYPPGKNNYVLKEEQRYNAVPPIEGFDFGPWIEEMGLEALPHQTTIFPIQMNGWSYDYMLALDDTNCPARKAVRDNAQSAIESSVKKIAKENLPEVQPFFDQFGWRDFCNYISWAYTESIQLNSTFTGPLEVGNVFSVCQKAAFSQNQIYSQAETVALKNVTSNDLRKNLAAQADTWATKVAKALGKGPVELTQAQTDKAKSVEGVAGAENPKYMMYWAAPDFLNALRYDIL